MKKRNLPIGALALTLIAALIAVAALVIAQPSLTQRTPKAATPPVAVSTPEASANLSQKVDVSAFPDDHPTTSRATSEQPAKQTATETYPSARTDAPAVASIGGDMGTKSSVAPVSFLAGGETGSGFPNESSAPAMAGVRPTPHFGDHRTPAQILAGKDLSDAVQRAAVVTEMTASEDARYASVLAKAEKLGVPARVEGPEGGIAIIYDFRGDKPLYRVTLNANAAISTGANLVRQTAPYNLNGSGVKVGVWDGGSVRNTHQELGTNRVVKRNSTAANDDHATHVAGTIGAAGVRTNAKGMAPLVAIDSYDWNNDYAEMTAAGAAAATNPSSKIPISNHSYGYNASTDDMGRYESECNTTDALAAGLPYYLIFWAAGNEQDELVELGGYQSITFNGLAKNIMTIGAADDAVTSGLRDVSKGKLAYFSSMGPCDDGRVKPDVVANGMNVFSCVASNNSSYDGTYSGTSMASPNAAGSAVLLQQLYKTNFSGQLMRSSMLKALIIHTASDVGRPGPDYQYGWGYMNVKAAADLILAHKASLAAPKMIEDSIDATNKVRTNSLIWDGTSPISATLVWTDPAGAAQSDTNSRTRNLVNDLDLKITAPDGTTSYFPYVMPFVGLWTTNSMTNNAVTGTNKVDNVERVYIAAPTQAGTYAVTVGMYGTNALRGTNQAYSLVVTGGQSVSPPPTPTPSPTPVPTPSPAPPATTFEATDTPQIIPDNSSGGITSVIEVSTPDQLSSLSLSANISHTYKGDLVVTLISPTGQSKVMHNRTGGDEDNVVFVNEQIMDFDGIPAAGKWKLRVQDLSPYDTGILNSWSLTISTSGASPSPTPQPDNKTFVATDLPSPIPDNNPTGITSPINVSSASTISSMAVSVNIAHPFKGDLIVTLEPPTGTNKVVLHNRTGSSQDNVVFVSKPITDFNGFAALGEWKLRVQDMRRLDKGTLNSWSLTINTSP